jgi:hypothetical protein
MTQLTVTIIGAVAQKARQTAEQRRITTHFWKDMTPAANLDPSPTNAGK